MPSTLHMFRKHQRVLMVMTTGLAMISFVLLGATQSRPGDMPAVLVVLALAAMFGGAAWVYGQINGKSSEYLGIGAVAGAVLGLYLSWGKQTPIAAYIDSGNITYPQMSEMKRERYLANSFLRQAFQRVNGMDPAMIEQWTGRPILFGFRGYSEDDDIVLTELLKREATRLGIGVDTDGVFEFIKGISSMSGFSMGAGKNLTTEQFTEIRSKLGASEEQLISAIADELKARKAFALLYSNRPSPTPEALYDYYSKLNVLDEADVAVLKVSDFIDDKAEPPQKELDELFAKYRKNYEGYGEDGRAVEGQPGFYQPPRVKLAYLEASYDTFEKQAGEVTDAEIQKRYDEIKNRPALPDIPDLGKDMPLLPPIDPNNLLNTNQTAPVVPPSTPANIPPVGDKLTTPDLPKTDASKPTETKADAAPATPPAPATPEKPTDPPNADGAKPMSSRAGKSTLSFVGFEQDKNEPPPPPVAETAAPAASPPAAQEKEAPAKDAPTKDAPVADPGAPAKDSSALPTGDAPKNDDTPPVPTVRPLDDAYRAELKAQILKERTEVLIEKKIQEAAMFMANDVGMYLNSLPDDKGHLTPEEASKKLKAYAEKNGLVYVETTELADDELRDSEDYPIGKALVTGQQQKQTVADEVFQNFGRSLLNLPHQATHPTTNSQFAYWVTAERKAYEPTDMKEAIVRNEVIKAWRELKAREKATARAEELVKLAKEANKPLVDAFAEVRTNTAKPDANYVSVVPTGKFSWFSMPSAPTTSLRQEGSPTLTEIPRLAPLGDQFFSTVFDKMKPGDIGVAASADKSEVFVVKINSRTPSTPEELEAFRQKFLSRGLSQEYDALAGRDWALYGKNGLMELREKNHVRIMTKQTNSDES